jgi:putative PEP-CTERM system histidine kinase
MPLASTIFTLAYGAASIGFLALVCLIVLRPIDSRLGKIFLATSFVSALVFGAAALSPWVAGVTALRPIDSMPVAGWTVFLLVAMRKTTAKKTITVLTAILGIAWCVDIGVQLKLFQLSSDWRYLPRTLLALLAVICAEHVIRSATEAQRWAIKHLVLAIIASAGFELIMFSHAMVFASVDPALLVTRGFVWAFACPLLAVSAVRNPSWNVAIHVSRDIVFHSVAVLVAGAFLLLLGVMGYLVSANGWAWGTVIQSAGLVLSLLALATALISGTIRSRIRAFVETNFYNYRFDYRREWLRFTDALGTTQTTNVFQVVTDAFRVLGDASGGAVYTQTPSGSFELRYRHGMTELAEQFRPPENLVLTTMTAIDLTVAGHGFSALIESASASAAARARFLVPLPGKETWLGAIVLTESRADLKLDREVADLFQVAARQAAGYLTQYEATAELLVARQFETFNRMSAFVVHDLKNLAAQLALLSSNAERHHANPEFQKDMLETVRHVTERMRGLLAQLSGGSTADPLEVVTLSTCIAEALRSKPGLSVQPVIQHHDTETARVLAHAQRLSRIIGHLIQNADEALPPERGMITININKRDRDVVLVVEDNGAGMSESFIQEKLFRPFVTTKTTGMGIGVYESQNYLREIGGAMKVSSQPGISTRFEIVLPLASSG